MTHYLGLYWTLPVPWAGFTRLPKDAKAAAARSRTIAYQRERVRRWVAEEGLSLDVCTGGELAVALRAGVPTGRLLFHGNNKSLAELERAVEVGVGRVVVDSAVELDRLAGVADRAGVRQRVLLRVTPGVEAQPGCMLSTFASEPASWRAQASARTTCIRLVRA